MKRKTARPPHRLASRFAQCSPPSPRTRGEGTRRPRLPCSTDTDNDRHRHALRRRQLEGGIGRADIFLTYCTNALAARKEYPGQQIVALPEHLGVGADYGLTVINGAAPAAQGFADYVMSAEGQKILMSHGFALGR